MTFGVVASSGPLAGAEVSDNFNRADGAIGSAWSVVSGTWSVDTNRGAAASGDNASAIAVYNTDLSSANHYAQADVVSGFRSLAGNTQTFALVICYSNSSNYYWARFNDEVSALQIYRLQGGSNTLLNSTSYSWPGNPYTLKFQKSGSNLTLSINGSSVLTATDSALSGLKAGIRCYDTDVTVDFFDNFEAGAV